MDGSELVGYVRKYLVRDTAEPLLFPTSLILQLLNEAQEKFVRRTGHSLSATTVELVAVAGDEYVDLPEEVINILAVRVNGAVRPLPVSTADHLPYTTNEGQPTAYSLDEATGAVRVFPVPDIDYTLKVRAVTVPEEFDLSQQPGIPKRFHTLLTYYAAWQCLFQNETDRVNVTQAEKYEAVWERGLVDAHREYMQLRTGPRPVARPSQNWTGKRA